MSDPQAAPPIPATPPRYGLLVAADTIVGDTLPAAAGIEGAGPTRWAQGITWGPEQLGVAGAIAIECEGDTDSVDFAGNGDFETAVPFIVYATDKCSTMGFAARDYTGRATRQLLATQSFSVAREFQLGAIAGADNANLTDGDVITPGSVSVVDAFAELEGAIGERLAGRQAMIHVTPQVFTLAMAARLIYQTGQKWLTAQGSVVVSDAGYTTEGSDVYAYATGLVKVLLAAPIIIPGSFEDAVARAQSINRSTNLVEIVAERLALVQFDSGDDADAIYKVKVNTAPWVVT